MPAGMPLTLVAANAASHGAYVQHPANDFVVGPCSARRDAAGDITDIGAIQVQPDALDQVLHHILSQTGVGARRAGLGAGVTLFNTADKGVVGASSHVWVRANHLSCMHG